MVQSKLAMGHPMPLTDALLDRILAEDDDAAAQTIHDARDAACEGVDGDQDYWFKV